jgi:hypothetical protein
MRGQVFVAILISVMVGIAAAGMAGYHVFERGLEAAYQARLKSIVGEGARVLDAGIRAGLAVDQPHLLQQALAGDAAAPDRLALQEIVSVVDPRGRIVASTNGAEIGEMAPAAWTAVGPVPGHPRLLLASHEIKSLFGTSEGMIVARLPAEVTAARATAFLFQLLIAGTLIGAGTALLAAALLWLVPWPALRRAEALRDMMDALYDRVGGSGAPDAHRPLPRQIEQSALRFRGTTIDLYGRLQREREELSRLDEAA